MNSLEKLIEITKDFNEELEESAREKRINIIAQNGNDGYHYNLDEESEEPNKAVTEDRKSIPVYSGCISYFPDALKEIAKCSYEGQKQHNPDKPLGWDRSKSGDELDAMMRHLMDYASGVEFDECGTRHIVKCGWRMLAYIQKEVEK